MTAMNTTGRMQNTGSWLAIRSCRARPIRVSTASGWRPHAAADSRLRIVATPRCAWVLPIRAVTRIHAGS
jgi:hypothetical protein